MCAPPSSYRLRYRRTPALLGCSNANCCLDRCVGIQGNGINSLVHQPLGKLGEIRRRLATDTDGLFRKVSGVDGFRNHAPYRDVVFVKQMGNHAGIAVESERQLSQIVRTDGVAVKYLQEFISRNYVGWDLIRSLPDATHCAP